MRFQAVVQPINRRLRCTVLGHTWAAKGGTIGNPHAVTTYSVCTHCGARRVVQEGNVYQPVDWEWLNWHIRQVEA